MIGKGDGVKSYEHTLEGSSPTSSRKVALAVAAAAIARSLRICSSCPHVSCNRCTRANSLQRTVTHDLTSHQLLFLLGFTGPGDRQDG